MCEACSNGFFWTNEKVTPAQLRDEVVRLAEDSPDRLEKCVYTYYNSDSTPVKPGCIVGAAIYNITGKYVPSNLEGACNSIQWQDKLGIGFGNNEDLYFVRDVQHEQDCGKSWGEALSYAREEDSQRNA